jgi:hypothetical protein
MAGNITMTWANRSRADWSTRDRGVPIMSFGEDEQGEIYYMTYTTSGQGIYWFVPSGNGKGKTE